MSPKFTKTDLFKSQGQILTPTEKSSLKSCKPKSLPYVNYSIAKYNPTSHIASSKCKVNKQQTDLSYLKTSSVFDNLKDKTLKQKKSNLIYKTCLHIERGVSLLSKGSINLEDFKSLLKWSNVPIEDMQVRINLILKK